MNYSDRSDTLILDNDQLRVAVMPQVGGTITSIQHKGLNASVLGSTPWDPIPFPLASCAAPNEDEWLTRYGGGWPLLFPNGGDACEFDGVFHGFHGEASITPWSFDCGSTFIRLQRKLFTVPVEMERELVVSEDVLTITEKLRMMGRESIRVMWAHHPTFGADLLRGDFEIGTGAQNVIVDDTYDLATNPLKLGAKGSWPVVPGKAGEYNLSRPTGDVAAMAYLHNFESPWVSICQLDRTVGAVLSWDSRMFPYAWLWYELAGTSEPPWYGRARLLGVEPSTSWPGTGLADINNRGGELLTLNPGDEIITMIRLHVFKPSGSIRGITDSGHAVT
jgi:hypothetical protein